MSNREVRSRVLRAPVPGRYKRCPLQLHFAKKDHTKDKSAQLVDVDEEAHIISADMKVSCRL